MPGQWPSSCDLIPPQAVGLCSRQSVPYLGNRLHRCIPRTVARQALDVPAPGCWALSSQSSTQEIGEELINGVIYSISLRKVQLHHGGNKGQRWLGVSAPGVSTRRRSWGSLLGLFHLRAPSSDPKGNGLHSLPDPHCPAQA